MKKFFVISFLAVLAVLTQPASGQAIVGAYTYPSWYGGYYGGYSGGYYPLGFVRQCGLKFDLGRLPKAEKKIVEQGIVRVDEYPFGEVGRYDGRMNSVLRLDPGAYEVSIVLPDGRQWGSRYLVRFGEATPVYPPRLANFFAAEAQNGGMAEERTRAAPQPQPQPPTVPATKPTTPPAATAPAKAAPQTEAAKPIERRTTAITGVM